MLKCVGVAMALVGIFLEFLGGWIGVVLALSGALILFAVSTPFGRLRSRLRAPTAGDESLGSADPDVMEDQPEEFFPVRRLVTRPNAIEATALFCVVLVACLISGTIYTIATRRHHAI